MRFALLDVVLGSTQAPTAQGVGRLGAEVAIGDTVPSNLAASPTLPGTSVVVPVMDPLKWPLPVSGTTPFVCESNDQSSTRLGALPTANVTVVALELCPALFDWTTESVCGPADSAVDGVQSQLSSAVTVVEQTDASFSVTSTVAPAAPVPVMAAGDVAKAEPLTGLVIFGGAIGESARSLVICSAKVTVFPCGAVGKDVEAEANVSPRESQSIEAGVVLLASAVLSELKYSCHLGA